MNRNRLSGWLYSTIGLLLLALSLYILQQELARYNLQDILNSLSSICARQLFFALGFTFLSCLAISCYDSIAFRCFKYGLDFKRILFTTFITYAISNTTGFNLVIGGGIRYRFYSLWGVRAKDIAKITAFGNLTFWLGLLTLTGITFVINPVQLSFSLHLDLAIIRCIGIVALLLAFSYLYLCYCRKKIRVKGKKISFPKPIIALFQIAIFTIDWALAAAVLYCLLLNYINKSYFDFFNIYLIAMTASIISNVPGGLGVFETAIIFLLPKTMVVPNVLSSLLIYRTVRFLLPLTIAIFLICCFEVKRRIQTKNKSEN